jgi:hypothetical protein
MLWSREHNTKGAGSGRLHLNVLWGENWIDQKELSAIAAECGFGPVVSISRVGPGSRYQGQRVEGYATKCLKYATKDLGSQADWPKGTRRWGASKSARAQMKRPDKNPDWFWSPVAPPSLPLEAAQFEYWLLPDECLPTKVGSPPASPVELQLPLVNLPPRPPDPTRWH